jgi:hypothetical protein
MIRFTTLASLAALLVASPALAQEAIFPRGVEEIQIDSPASVVGVTATAGGGAEGFIEDAATGFTQVGGAWNLRLTFLSRFIVSPELAYIGSVQDVDALGLTGNPSLLSNGGEANLRVNILPGVFQPYVFGGVGYRNYQIVNEDSNTSAIADEDNIGIVPVGGGFTVRLDNFLLDARGTFRWAFDDEMLSLGPDDGLGMSTWSAELRAGVEI